MILVLLTWITENIYLFAPIRFNPQPPAFELNIKINSFDSGLLKFSTTLARFLIVIVPSNLTYEYPLK